MGSLVGIGVISVQLWQGMENVEQKRQKMKSSAADVSPTSTSTVQEEPEDSTFIWKDRPKQGEKVGTLSIPRIDEEIPILEGTGEQELDRGVGHHTSSVLPGEPDNAVLAGHRETALRHAKEIQKGDPILVKTEGYTFNFQVKKLWVADKDDPQVVTSNGKEEPRLIVYTCWPVEAVFSGYAPKRYVIESELTAIEKN